MEIKRDYYLNQLISKMHNGLIKVVTGMRRCWKSYLLFNLFREYLISKDIDKDHIIEISFDTFENKKFCNPDILYPYFKELIKDDKMYYILLDEVQLMGEFESILNSLNRSKTIKKSSKGSKSKSPLLLFYYRKLKNRKGKQYSQTAWIFRSLDFNIILCYYLVRDIDFMLCIGSWV